MPNWLARTLISGAIASIAVGVYYGTVSSGELGLYMFALLIALNCQDWKK